MVDNKLPIDLVLRILARERAVNLTYEDWEDILFWGKKARNRFGKGSAMHSHYENLIAKIEYIMEVFKEYGNANDIK